MNQKEFLSIKEVSDLLGISRIAVFRRVKLGQIKAQKIGRNFAINKSELSNILGESLSIEEKRSLKEGVKKTIKDFSETLEKLGKE
jgi:excisionase family DNA binding protein